MLNQLVMKRVLSLSRITLFAAITFAVSCSKPFVIVQVSDVQMGFSAAAMAGKSGEECADDVAFETECLRKAVGMINDINPDVVVFTGDQVNVAGNQTQWSAFDEIVGEINPEVKCLYLPGNHDVLIKDGSVCMDEYSKHCGADKFCYKDKGVILVGVNTNLISNDDSLEEEQFEWLRDVLSCNSSRDGVTLVFGHHPFFLSDIDEPDSYFPIMKSKRRVYFDLFATTGVDAVYAGHRHETFDAEFCGIPMKTTTSAAYQIGKSMPSVRVIVVEKGKVRDELREYPM